MNQKKRKKLKKKQKKRIQIMKRDDKKLSGCRATYVQHCVSGHSPCNIKSTRVNIKQNNNSVNAG